MKENLFKFEAAISATSSGNLTYELWTHDYATAIGWAGQRNPLGFAVVRYLSEEPSSMNAWGLALVLTDALMSQGYSDDVARSVAWKSIEAWNDLRCTSCSGRGVSVDRKVCAVCDGSGQKDLNNFSGAVNDGIACLVKAEQWMESQLSSRLKR